MSLEDIKTEELQKELLRRKYDEVLKQLTKENEVIQKELEEIQEKQKQAFEKVIKEILTKIPDVKLVCITGHTPSFNDGDVCTHSQDVEVNSVGDDYPEDYEHLGEIPELPWEFTNKVIKVIQANSDAVDNIYGTNYRVIYTLKDGEVVRDEDDYDCGY